MVRLAGDRRARLGDPAAALVGHCRRAARGRPSDRRRLGADARRSTVPDARSRGRWPRSSRPIPRSSTPIRCAASTPAWSPTTRSIAQQWALSDPVGGVNAPTAWDVANRKRQHRGRRARYRHHRASRARRPRSCRATTSSAIQQRPTTATDATTTRPIPATPPATANAARYPGRTEQLARHLRQRHDRRQHQQRRRHRRHGLEREDRCRCACSANAAAPSTTSPPACCGRPGLPVAGAPTNPSPARVINMSLGGTTALPAGDCRTRSTRCSRRARSWSSPPATKPSTSPARRPPTAAASSRSARRRARAIAPAIRTSARASTCRRRAATATSGRLDHLDVERRQDGPGQSDLRDAASAPASPRRTSRAPRR